MKTYSIIFLFFCCSLFSTVRAQDADKIYGTALDYYNQKEYSEAAMAFDGLLESYGSILNEGPKYNGACIYALAGETDKAFDLLFRLVKENYFSDPGRLLKDDDFDGLRRYGRWQELLAAVEENVKTLPQRQAKKVEAEIVKARKILMEDGGRLWGDLIWDDRILILCNDLVVYSVLPFEGSEQVGESLYRTRLPEGSLFYTNCVQHYQGESYAVVMYSYLNDYSSTIIHELFHVLQYKYREFYGEQIVYMDNNDARLLLRLEYHALKNCLSAMDSGKDDDVVRMFLNDAIGFRKMRQSAYPEWLDRELELETLEGMANYTGYKLSTWPNLYQRAIRVIDMWEYTDSYIRSFSYATGPAYGFIFDHLGIDWRRGPQHICDFRKIYEDNFGQTLFDQDAAYARNDYDLITGEEIARAEKNRILTEKYTAMLVESPVLTAEITEYSKYGQTYDMNGTFILDGHGMIYTSDLAGDDDSGGANFGNFIHYHERSADGISGIMLKKSEEGVYSFIFPAPLLIEGNKIIGETYEIELNEGWTVEKVNDKGDYKIVKR